MFIKNTEFILLKNLDWTFDLNKLVKFLFFFKLIPLSKPPFKELEQKLLLLLELEFCLFNWIILSNFQSLLLLIQKLLLFTLKSIVLIFVPLTIFFANLILIEYVNFELT